MEWIIKLPTDGGCSSASSSVSEEEDGSVDITVLTIITVVINSRTSVYLWLGGWLASIYRTVRVYLLLQLRHPRLCPL